MRSFFINDAALNYINALPKSSPVAQSVRPHLDGLRFTVPAQSSAREAVWRSLSDEVGLIDERIERLGSSAEREALRQAMRGLSTMARKTLLRGDVVRRNVGSNKLFAIVMHAKTKKPMLAFSDDFDVFVYDEHMGPVAQGHYDVGYSRLNAAPEGSGYPRAHTPIAFVSTADIGRGLGAVLYNSMAAGARARYVFGGDQPSMRKVGSGISSSSTSRSTDADNFWNKALEKGFSFRTEIAVELGSEQVNFSEVIQPEDSYAKDVFYAVRGVFQGFDNINKLEIQPDAEDSISADLTSAIIEYLTDKYSVKVLSLDTYKIEVRRSKFGIEKVMPISIQGVAVLKDKKNVKPIPIDVLPYTPTKGASGAGQMVLCNFEPTYVSLKNMAALPGLEGYIWVERDVISDFNVNVLRLLDLTETPKPVMDLIEEIAAAYDALDVLEENLSAPRSNRRSNGLTPAQQAAARRVRLADWADLDD